MSEETRIMSGPPQRIAAGTRLSEIYEVQALIATGGMGEVYRGRVIETGDPVAIKTILPEFAQNESALSLFRKEASALHHVNHEAIVRYYVFTVDRQLGVPYLAMEYVSGDPLCDLIRHRAIGFEPWRVLQRRLASGLQAAHDRGIFHRDVSPDNIILPDGDVAQAKIIDFGIARSPLGEKTVIGSGFAGKFGYVSPEQLGLQGGEVGAASDIYSLGLVLGESALGRSLDMGGSHADVIDKRRRVPDLTAVDSRLRPLLESMLQPDPAKRPRSMSEVAAWNPIARQAKASAGKGRSLVLAAGILLLIGAGAGGYLLLPLVTGDGGRPRLDEPSSGLEERAPAAFNPLPPVAPPPQGRTPPPAAPAMPPEPVISRPPAPVPSPPAPAIEAAPPASPARPAPPVSASAPIPAPVPAPRPITAPSPIAPEQAPPPAPVAEPAPRRGPATAEQITAFIRAYRPGSCAALSPVSVAQRDAVVEAFGVQAAPFEAFDADFQRGLGLEPRIQLRLINAGQCPPIDLLSRQTASPPANLPKLVIRPDVLPSGQELTGTADSGGQANLELVLVADDGLAHTITSFAKRTGDSATFSLRVEGSGAVVAKPQLLIAIASPKPLPSVQALSGVPAGEAFRKLEDEMARARVTPAIAIRYFKLVP